jgi:hypothetical protein
MYFIEFCVWDCLLLYVHTTVVLHRPTGQDWVHYATPPLFMFFFGGGGGVERTKTRVGSCSHEAKHSFEKLSWQQEHTAEPNATPRRQDGTYRERA